jgi:segregation and condensation protein B
MRTLVARGLVEEAGHDAETTATLYRTTSYFLERIGVGSLDELPELAPFLPEMGELDVLDHRAEVAEVAEVAEAPAAPEVEGSDTGAAG